MDLKSWLAEKPFTLALSSSFFGFYAHCGFAAALYESGLKPAKITGASAGALVGGALASGMSPLELRDILFSMRRKDFWDPFPGPGLLRGKKFRLILEKHFVMSFEQAKIPLEVAVLDIMSFKTKFLHQGPLPAAVAASCAVPGMFHPVRIGRKFYYDGGVFHKCGINQTNKNERILSVYLDGKGFSGVYEWNKSIKHLGANQAVLKIDDIPAVNPNSMELGQKAYNVTYQKTLKFLTQPSAKLIGGSSLLFCDANQ